MPVVTLGRDTIATNMVFIVYAFIDNNTSKFSSSKEHPQILQVFIFSTSTIFTDRFEKLLTIKIKKERVVPLPDLETLKPRDDQQHIE